MRFDILGNLGAYLSQFGPYIPYLGGDHDDRRLQTPQIFVRVRGVYTNTVPVMPIAAPAARRPPISSSGWSTAPRARLGIEAGRDPPDGTSSPRSEMPYYDADRRADLRHRRLRRITSTKAMAPADWAGFKDRLQGSRKDGKIRGIGIATYIECTAWGEGEDVVVRLENGRNRDGVFGHAVEWAGPRHGLRAVRLPAARHAARQDPGHPGRHGRASRRATARAALARFPIGGVSVFAASRESCREAEGTRGGGCSKPASPTSKSPTARVRVVGTDRRITFADLAALPQATEELRYAETAISCRRTPPIRTARISPRSRSIRRPASPTS